MISRVRANVGLIVLCGCLISLVTIGVRASFGMFTDPLTETHGWDREVFALAIAIQNLLWGLGQPAAGAVADRFGPGRVLTAGAVLYAAGTALMAVSTTPIALHLTGGLLIGLGLSGASFTIVIAAFSRLMPADRRSWAIGLATATGSLGQFLFAPIGQGFVAAYGWQVALALLGAFVALVPGLAVALGGTPADHDHDEEPSVPVTSACAGPSATAATCCSLAASSSAASTSPSSPSTCLPTSTTSASRRAPPPWPSASLASSTSSVHTPPACSAPATAHGCCSPASTAPARSPSPCS